MQQGESQVRPVRRNSADGAVEAATEALLGLQKPDGHWAFELEADATIPAEYVLLQHYLDEIDDDLNRKIGVHLRRLQGDHGGWPLFHDGDFDMSASVKAYFALKAIGDRADAAHMIRARAAILERGGAARSNVFTRILLALFGEVPWRAVPVMPVEIMNLPRWFPFHLDKVSYWTRTVLVPLLVVMAVKPRARNPRRITISELFVEPPARVRRWHVGPDRSPWAVVFRGIDRVLQRVEPLFPKAGRDRAIARAVAWVAERLNGEDGLGAIYPAMANAVMLYECLGYPADYPPLVTAKAALRKLLVIGEESAYCQPCLSPVWDTALACHALLETGDGSADNAARRGLDWLVQRQVLDVVGDWAASRPGVRPGGRAFQYANPHYPDLDDTAAVVLALDRADSEGYRDSIARGQEWVLGLQSRNGGWGAFDADNTYHYLNHIPFADHGALLDPPTEDVTGRCLGMLSQLGCAPDHPAVRRAVAYLRREQQPDGSWFGRWGTNYIYGTWSVLAALNAAAIGHAAPEMRRAVTWLLSKQRADGGWGEDGASYWPDRPRGEGKVSTASQTAWALLALMAAGEVDNPAVERGIRFLVETQRPDGQWEEESFTAVGFPRVFYLRYHGYRLFFPLWALARFRALRSGNSKTVSHGL
jgi:squalene-hopene/tetraprenyl-beta-curcumene cyclase